MGQGSCDRSHGEQDLGLGCCAATASAKRNSRAYDHISRQAEHFSRPSTHWHRPAGIAAPSTPSAQGNSARAGGSFSRPPSLPPSVRLPHRRGIATPQHRPAAPKDRCRPHGTTAGSGRSTPGRLCIRAGRGSYCPPSCAGHRTDTPTSRAPTGKWRD